MLGNMKNKGKKKSSFIPFPPMSGEVELVTPPLTKGDWVEACKNNYITIHMSETHAIGTHFEKNRNDLRLPTPYQEYSFVSHLSP